MISAKHLSSACNPQERAARIQHALDHAQGHPVVIPPGTWVITTIQLPSGSTLELSRGSVLKVHPILQDYPKILLNEQTTDNGDRQPYSLITAKNAQDIVISGQGTIDGDGFAFWDPPMIELAKAGIDVERYCDEHNLPPVYRNPKHPWWRERKTGRVSPLLDFNNCQQICIQNVTIRNSPGWTVHLNSCDDVRLNRITLKNHLFGPNSDGFDINGCHDVIISDCDLTCGDDAIIIKAMSDARSCERIAINNCILASNCAAFGIGAETVFPIRDISVSNCVVRQALRAVQIEMWEAGIVENVSIVGLTGTTNCPIPLQRAIYLDVQHFNRTDGALGKMRNILISNIALTTRGRIVATAADGTTIDGLTLRDIHLTMPTIEDASVTVPKFRSNQMSNSSPHTRAVNAGLVCDNVRNLVVENLNITWPGAIGNPPDPSANTELNPHHTDPAMHGAYLRRSSGHINAPNLSAFDPKKQGQVERICQVESSVQDR